MHDVLRVLKKRNGDLGVRSQRQPLVKRNAKNGRHLLQRIAGRWLSIAFRPADVHAASIEQELNTIIEEEPVAQNKVGRASVASFDQLQRNAEDVAAAAKTEDARRIDLDLAAVASAIRRYLVHTNVRIIEVLRIHSP